MSEPTRIERGRVRKTDVAPGMMQRISFPPYDILVANVDGRFYAIEDACPHSGFSLCTGKLRGTRVVCPGHEWELDVRDGRVRLPVGVDEGCPVFETRDEGDYVVVYSPS